MKRLATRPTGDSAEILKPGEPATMSSVPAETKSADSYHLRFHWRILGSTAPVFPGLETDISDRVDDSDKPEAVWHRQRVRGMLAAHPEIKELFGPTPSTAIWCVVFVALQLGLAVALSSQPLWLIALMAYIFGSWINVNLFMLAHECNHDLVFKRKRWNRWFFTVTSLPMALSAHHTWWAEHHAHHNDLGAKKDFVKRRRLFLLETRRRFLYVFNRGRWLHLVSWMSSPLFFPYSLFVVPLQTLRSLIGVLSYGVDLMRFRTSPSDATLSILADEHLVSGYRRNHLELWGVAYAALSILMLVALFLIGGWGAILYLLLAQIFMTGFLHPTVFGMILSDSHFHGRERYQPSTSYYGWRNLITFNYGLHTEHHDLPAVAWSRLPQLRKIAPEFYDPLVKTRSYALLALRFVFGRRSAGEDAFDAELARTPEQMDLVASS